MDGWKVTSKQRVAVGISTGIGERNEKHQYDMHEQQHGSLLLGICVSKLEAMLSSYPTSPSSTIITITLRGAGNADAAFFCDDSNI
jgi:hypothetical protein